MPLLIILLLALGSPALAQWDQVHILAPDSFYTGMPQYVVDDSFRLHVFCARGMNGMFDTPNSMMYLKFDSWGNLLSGPTELWPNTHYQDGWPAVLLDRNQIIHVLWSRRWDVPTYDKQVIYVRLNTQGEHLTPPTVIDTGHYVDQYMNLAQSLNGDVWGVGSRYMCAFHEDGVNFVPFQRIFPLTSGADCFSPILAAGPDGHMYCILRYFPPSDSMSAVVTRLDTTVRQVRVVAVGSAPWINIGVGSFYIDTSNVWHSMIGRDDGPWWFYQRDTPDGQRDTLNIAWLGHGPFFHRVGGDTLVLIWAGGSTGPYYYYRSGIHLNGTLAFEPVVIPLMPHEFDMPYLVPYEWKAGSYWVIGLRVGTNYAHRLAMIHVPGPNEPPPGAAAPPRAVPHTQALAVSVSPNPAQNILKLYLSPMPRSRVQVKLFNLLGQEITRQEFEALTSPNLSLALPGRLPAGSYYGIVMAGDRLARFTFIVP